MAVASICERDGRHHFFVFERAVTEDPTTMHGFAICTDCGQDKHLKYLLESPVIYIGSKPVEGEQS